MSILSLQFKHTQCGPAIKKEYMDFKSFNLNPKIVAGVEAAGFTQPTPIQEQTIPKIMQHRDVMGLAQTGTGKTAAFGLPIMHQLMKGRRGCVRALIVAPTRELAEQIHEALAMLGKETGLRSVTIYGGVGINPQISKLKRGAEIVVACPGRLLDHIKQSTIDLSQRKAVVAGTAAAMQRLETGTRRWEISACSRSSISRH